ncbi:MAG TPA: hypothetical protein VFR43_03445 [Gaiellaceae bacterium]|nr:hypothetical protein [Gaiellaceae bacterium]
MDQLVQVAGALLVLAGFALTQLGVLETRAYSYLLVNLFGAGILTVLAWNERQWGFLLLEGAWTLVAAGGLVARARADRLGGRRPAGASRSG